MIWTPHPPARPANWAPSPWRDPGQRFRFRSGSTRQWHGEAGQSMVHQAASPGVGGRGQVGLPLVAVVGTGVAAVTNRE